MSTHHYDKHDERAIVDPSVWESTKVGGAEDSVPLGGCKEKQSIEHAFVAVPKAGEGGQ